MICPKCGNSYEGIVCNQCGTPAPDENTATSTVLQEPSANDSGLKCPKCGSANIIVQAVTDVKTKHRGCLAWCAWIMLAILTVGLIIIIPLITNSKVKSKTHTEAVCQNCGNRWKV